MDHFIRLHHPDVHRLQTDHSRSRRGRDPVVEALEHHFLRMGPVTIAVDSYGPVTNNAQSVYELSLIENVPNVQQEIKRDFGFDVKFERAKHLLEANDGAGNTFKATAKPVLIGTAVVGATTMIFSIIMALTNGLTDTERVGQLSPLHAPCFCGLLTGRAMLHWFTG